MLALVNPRSAGGRGARRWQRIEAELMQRYPGLRADCGPPAEVPAIIERALDQGECWFIAAGGDGTVNLVASALARHGCAGTLGAIGLGSSNDFHKPVTRRLHGIPARLDFAHAEPRDVCVVELTDDSGLTRTRHFLVNASVGVTAEANWRFNHPGPVLAALKRITTDGAILAAALQGIVLGRALRVQLTIDGTVRDVALKNLGVTKSAHFAGGLRYDTPFEPRSGAMHVHRIGAVGIYRLLRILAALSRGAFTGLGQTESWRASAVRLTAAEPFAVECDGEVTRAVAAGFSVLPQRLWCAA